MLLLGCEGPKGVIYQGQCAIMWNRGVVWSGDQTRPCRGTVSLERLIVKCFIQHFVPLLHIRPLSYKRHALQHTRKKFNDQNTES